MFDGDFESRPRELPDLVMGLPAVFSCILLVPFLSYVWSRESKLEDVYRREAVNAYQAQQHELAVVCFDRIVRISPRDEDRYHLGLSLVESGDKTRGSRILQGLANVEKQGYGPSHVWQAKQLISGEGASLDEALQAIAHLTHAKKTMYKDGEVSFLLANCFWATDSKKKALEALSDAAHLQPAYFYDLFKACQTERYMQAADRAAALSATYLSSFTAENPLDREARHKYIEVQVWLNSFDAAEKTLEQGTRVDKDGQWNRVLADVYLARFRQRKSEDVGLGELLGYLEKAMAADPENEDVLRELTDVGIVDPSGRIQKMLEQALTSGQHNAIVHFVLGSRLWQLNLVEDGVFHMKRAYELDSRLGFAANNLAYHELQKDDGDYEAGLSLINELLVKFPDAHAFRETRGQLLARLKKWNEALNDLEYALVKFPNEQQLHSSLAKCYRELGQEQLAENHQKIAEGLDKNVP